MACATKIAMTAVEVRINGNSASNCYVRPTISVILGKVITQCYHLTREYGVDPLEIVIVGELMSPPVEAVFDDSSPLPELFVFADCTCRSAAEVMATEGLSTLPVVDRETQQVSGSITLQGLLRGRTKAITREQERLSLFG